MAPGPIASSCGARLSGCWKRGGPRRKPPSGIRDWLGCLAAAQPQSIRLVPPSSEHTMDLASPSGTLLDFEDARQRMVDSQIRPNKVTDPRVLAAMARTAREKFLPPHLLS